MRRPPVTVAGSELLRASLPPTVDGTRPRDVLGVARVALALVLASV